MTHKPALRNLPDGSLTREEVNGLLDEIVSYRSALARIGEIAKAFDISMGGKETFHPLAPPRVELIRDIVRNTLDDS